MKKQIPAWLVLGIIMMVAAFCLAGTNMITKDIIDRQQVLNDENARKAVLAEAEAFEEIPLEEGASIDSLFVAKKGEETIGHVGVTTVKGYGGPIKIIAGVNNDGVITGINVGGSAFAETAGLGAKAKEADFTDRFQGKKAPIKVIKAGEEKTESTVDAITAATITSGAIARGVNGIAKLVNESAAPAAGAVSFAGGNAKASADGFAGPVVVDVTFDQEGTITALTIGDDQFGETDGFGGEALKPEFAAQFIGKKAPVKLSDIDALSGATITSEAVVTAINKAMEQLSAPAAVSFAGGNAKAASDGFAGPVAVDVTFEQDGTITALTIGDDQFGETDGFGGEALKPEFAAQFIGKKAPVKLSDIDALSGATITSEAVVTAINKAMEQLSAPAAVSFAGGNAKASADGFAGPVAVDVTFEQDGTITALTIGDDQFGETDGFGGEALKPEFAAQFIGKKAPVKLSDIDALSGATITSEAVVDAINKAMEQLSAPAAQSEAAPAEVPQATEAAKATEALVAQEEPMPEGVMTVSKDGFAGPVAVAVKFAADNATIEAIKIGDDKFSETDGLGGEALKPEFAAQFIGKKAPLTIKDIDAIAGATITSEAVVDAINEAQKQTAPAEETVQATEAPAAEATEVPAAATAEPMPEGMMTVSKDGFAGPVAVAMKFAADNATIEAIKIGDDKFSETDGLGGEALKPEFAAQFIGKKAPLTLKDIDAIAGATITSEAVVDAINEAQKQTAPAEETVQATEAPVVEATEVPAAATAEPMPEGMMTVSKDGFAGPVAVAVKFAADNATIEAIKIGDDKFDETPGLGGEALKPEFAAQFIGKKAPLTLKDIDVIAGATITSEAVVDAINEAQKQAAPVGMITVSKDGFAGPVAVAVKFAADNATIEEIKIGDDKFSETDGFGGEALKPEFAAQFIGKKAPLTLKDIDAIAGATITSEAVVDAINEAQKQAVPSEEETSGEAVMRMASARGFAGDVPVEVSFDKDGVITSFKITDSSFADGMSYGKAVLEEGFAKRLIGKKAPLAMKDVDAVSFATKTVEAVVEAINAAYAQK